MQRVLRFPMRAWDRLTIGPGPMQPVYTFFDANFCGDAPSITSMTEEQTIQWIFRRPDLREIVIDGLGMEVRSNAYIQIQDPIITNSNEKPGDIDLLFVPSNPCLAVALEVKRVKVVAMDSGANEQDKRNKIQGLGAAVSQVNALAKMGFHRTYLAVVIQTDGRTRTSENVLFRGPRQDTIEMVVDFPRREALDEHVGVIFLHVVQPNGKDINEAGRFGVYVDHDPVLRAQEGSLSETLQRLDASHLAHESHLLKDVASR